MRDALVQLIGLLLLLSGSQPLTWDRFWIGRSDGGPHLQVGRG